MRRAGIILALSLALPAVVFAGPSFRDLAEMIAKGWFGAYVSPEAPISECISFLNRHGICFSLFDLADPNRTVSEEDFARVVGQAALLFRGEAEIKNGCIKKPEEANSWVDYCVLNDIEYKSLWEEFIRSFKQGP